LKTFNGFRVRHHLAPLLLRPISGFTGPTDELVSAFLLSDSICHATQLKNNSILQYLYYLEEIGISIPLLKQDAINADYKTHPFNKFLKRGLKVTLSTESPLQLHFTNEPLAEEYAIAHQVWKLGNVDIAEIARTSVLISGFSHEDKMKFIGENYHIGMNDPQKTAVPFERLQYRKKIIRR